MTTKSPETLPKKPTRPQLLTVLRAHLIHRTERGERVVGHVCGICGVRWKGLKERHLPTCVLAGSQPCMRWPACGCIVRGYVNTNEANDCGRA